VSSRANIKFHNYFSHESKSKLDLIQRQLNESVKIKKIMMLNTNFEDLNGLRNLNEVTNCTICLDGGVASKNYKELKGILRDATELISQLETLFDGTTCADLEQYLHTQSALNGECINEQFTFLSSYCGCQPLKENCELCTKKGENIPKPDADLKSILKSIGSDELIYSMEAMFDGTSCSDLEDLLGITSLLGGQCMNVDFIFLSIYCGCSSEIQCGLCLDAEVIPNPDADIRDLDNMLKGVLFDKNGENDLLGILESFGGTTCATLELYINAMSNQEGRCVNTLFTKFSTFCGCNSVPSCAESFLCPYGNEIPNFNKKLINMGDDFPSTITTCGKAKKLLSLIPHDSQCSENVLVIALQCDCPCIEQCRICEGGDVISNFVPTFDFGKHVSPRLTCGEIDLMARNLVSESYECDYGKKQIASLCCDQN